jgi:hypothetical protein
MYEDAIRHGFAPPDNLEDWTLFDDKDISKARDVVRPWISKEDYPFIEKAIYLVEELNSEMKGKNNTDLNAVNDAIMQIENLIADN